MHNISCCKFQVYLISADLILLQSKLPPKPPHQSKAEKLEDILKQMKNHVTIEEVNLAKILENKKKMKEEFPEVNNLLKEVRKQKVKC